MIPKTNKKQLNKHKQLITIEICREDLNCPLGIDEIILLLYIFW